VTSVYCLCTKRKASGQS